MTVTLVGDFAVYDGYGSMNLYLARGLHRAGARVSVLPLFADVSGSSVEFLTLLARSCPRMDGPVLFSSWMYRPEFDPFCATELFVRTMCEGSAIPPTWAPQLNRARAVLVPSCFVADVFRASGVTVPIAVVPDGVDPDVYRYERRPQRDGLTTLIVGVMQPRKHYREGVAAWQLAFRNDPKARLIIKSNMNHDDGFRTDDPRIEIHTHSDPSLGIAHWYRQADVLLALGSEGFGLPLIEGMATGLPVVALNAAGQADVCRDAGKLVLGVEPSGSEPNLMPDRSMVCGVRAVPNVEDVAAKLRWVADHRDEAADLGRAASAWVHRHRNVWSYGPDALAVIEEHTGHRRRLRRRGADGRGRTSPNAPPREAGVDTRRARPAAGSAGRGASPNGTRRIVPVVLTCERDLPTFRIFVQSLKQCVLPAVAAPVVIVDTSTSPCSSPTYLRLIASLQPASINVHPPQPGYSAFDSVQHAARYALERALAASRPQDLILFVEDDIVFSRWFPDVLRAYEPQADTGFLTLYLRGEGYHSPVIDPETFYGSQCLLFPRQAVDELVGAYDQVQAIPSGYDIRWSRFLALRGYRLYATPYSFVQHIGQSRLDNPAHCSHRFVP